MLKINIFGDICPVDGIKPLDVKIEEDALTIANLECALTDSPKPVKKAGPVLYAPESFAASLKTWGIDAVSLANNHIRDCGDEGVLSTLENCSKYGIKTFGAADTEEGAAKPLVIEKNGLKVGFLSFAEKEFNYVHDGKAGATFFDPYVSFDKIYKLRKEVDALVVLYHGGIEHYIYPSPLLRKKCRKMVEAGADVVLCQHSHCIGTHEKFGKGEILYGQGNSYFGYRKNNDVWNHGLLVRLDVNQSDVNVHYDVIETAFDGSERMASKEVAERILNKFELESAKLSDEAFLNQSWKEFCRRNKASYLAMVLGFGTNANRVNRLLKNGLVGLMYSRRELNVTHNIIRCDAHNEVVETILEDYEF
jgi:poly-gamma-glutamate synthesis protein (capsule biosynthesis protein)